jgi:two-component system chemotaxis response regulator CheB
VLEAQHGDELMPGTVYVSPPGRHISVTESLSVELGDGPRLDWNRPSADWLFGSLAQRLGPGVISVVLSGTRSDGAAGVLTVKRHGGRVIIQDPQTSRFADMPRASMATGCADFVLPSARISDALVTLAMVPGAMDLFSVPLPPWARLGRN